jgi:hypothetical protein
MLDIQSLIFEDESGDQYTVLVESDATSLISGPEPADDNRESYGFQETAVVKLKDVHETIRGYTKYALGAFKNLGDVQVEEISLKFSLKISAKAGLPILTESSAEGNFEIQVKCKFPDSSLQNN